MNLKEFNKDTCNIYVQKKATVRVSNNGKISFNLRAGEILDFKNNPKVRFFQDQENPKNWYIKSYNKGNVFLIKNYRTQGNSFFSSSLTTKILRSIDTGRTCKFILSHKKTGMYYALITHSKV